MSAPPDPTRTVPPDVAADAARDPDPGLTAKAPDPNASTGGFTTPVGASAAPASPGRYVLGELIAAGGMGVVYRATDTVLGREVAVKVLQDKFAPGSGTARRFADEARITGQLQHPGIPPVHDLGTLPDGRPFLAMKLIKGETLDELLRRRAGPAEDRGRFVAVFEAIGQALAYAHAHNVIHRDLKPANVMVGSFGEVQVMDWGLAKVLTPGRADDTDPLETSGSTAVVSLRDSDGSFTQAGSVLGTPAFMPPEQAVGAIGKIDARSDVFGLGGILAVILSGVPPFAAASAETTRVKAAQGDVAECFTRLDACGAEPDLVALAKRCLSPKPADRPGNAGEVARAVAAFRAAADDRARQAEVERAKAEVSAAEQRKRRRTAIAAAAALCLVLTLGIVGTVIGLLRADEQRKDAEGAREAEAEQRRAVEQQRDEISDREKDVAAQKALAYKRLEVYRQAVDMFANEAPSIIEGHPLGAAPLQDLLQLALRMSAATAGELESPTMRRGADMCVFIRQGHFAKTQGRIDDAEKHYNDGFRLAEELLREAKPGRIGTSSGNLALTISLRATILRTRAEIQAGQGDKEKARGMFAEAVVLHNESIAMFRRVVTEPDMRDIHVGEAEGWLAGGYLDLAETHRISVAAAQDEAGRRAAHEAGRAAAIKSEEHYAAWQASGWNERNVDRTRLRQALAVWEVARAAEQLKRDDEADTAFQRSFELFDRLVKDTPKNLLHRIQFSQVATQQGDFLLLKRKDPKRAGVAYAAATAQSRRLGNPPELRPYADAIGGDLYRQGIAALGSGDPVKARGFFIESVAHRQEQLREAIRISSENSLYTVLPRIRLMFSQARAGDHVAAAAIAARLRQDYPKDAARLNYVAQGFAICSLVTDDGEEEEAYRDKAFECLDRALDAGYADAGEMVNDPDYSALRDDPRFPPRLARAKENAAKKP